MSHSGYILKVKYIWIELEIIIQLNQSFKAVFLLNLALLHVLLNQRHFGWFYKEIIDFRLCDLVDFVHSFFLYKNFLRKQIILLLNNIEFRRLVCHEIWSSFDLTWASWVICVWHCAFLTFLEVLRYAVLTPDHMHLILLINSFNTWVSLYSSNSLFVFLIINRFVEFHYKVLLLFIFFQNLIVFKFFLLKFLVI